MKIQKNKSKPFAIRSEIPAWDQVFVNILRSFSLKKENLRIKDHDASRFDISKLAKIVNSFSCKDMYSLFQLDARTPMKSELNENIAKIGAMTQPMGLTPICIVRLHLEFQVLSYNL